MLLKHPNYREYPGYPEKFNSRTGQYEPIHKELPALKGSSKGYPGWICKRGCMENNPAIHEDYISDRCPHCGCRTLIRYIGYEVK